MTAPASKRRSWDETRQLVFQPCPFCGSDDIDVEHIGNDQSRKQTIIVSCCGCRIKRTHATIDYDFDWLERVAEKNWNQRAQGLDNGDRADRVQMRDPDERFGKQVSVYGPECSHGFPVGTCACCRALEGRSGSVEG